MGKLLIIADIKGSDVATPRGLELADKLGLEVEVVALVYAPLEKLKVGAAEQDLIRKRLIRDREEVVQARIDRKSRPGQSVKLKVVWEKDLAGWVNNYCARGEYEMVVKTGHRTDTLAHTSTDWQMLRECPAPVLIIAKKKWSHTKPVLACLDLGSTVPAKKTLNDTILQRASSLSDALDVELKIICAIEIPTLLADLDLVDPLAYVADAQHEMAPHIKALAKAHNLPEKAFKIKRGPVEKVLVSEAAAKRAQIVVMGTVGRKGVKARLLGNTAERVLQRLKTDVLAIKPR